MQTYKCEIFLWTKRLRSLRYLWSRIINARLVFPHSYPARLPISLYKHLIIQGRRQRTTQRAITRRRGDKNSFYLYYILLSLCLQHLLVSYRSTFRHTARHRPTFVTTEVFQQR